MKNITRSALVPYSAMEMFALVDNIETYPEFLPWCRSTEIIERDESSVCASIEIAKAGVHKSFTTKNKNEPGQLIEMQLVSGPFENLHGYWRFEELDEHASKVSLDISFKFSNRILDATVGPIFSQICNTLVEAFVKRAHELYGKK